MDENIFDHAHREEAFKIYEPTNCLFCSTPRGNAPLLPVKKGIVLSHMGFCEMEMEAYTCTKCKS